MNEGIEEREEIISDDQRRSAEEVEKLAKMGRGEIVEEPAKQSEEKKEGDERPAWLPEKFKSAEDLAKAYGELEKRLGTSKDAEDEKKADDEKLKSPKIGENADKGEDGDDKGDEKGGDEFSPDAVTKAITEARDAWAASGELGEDQRKALNAVGFDDATIDVYLEGVKAVEDAMRTKVFTLAGGEADYMAAVKWASENWSPKEIKAYDDALESPELLSKVVAGLMAEYRQAVPSEGRLTQARGSGQDTGTVYGRMEEFHADLEAAGDDRLKRQDAIEKLKRSRKAGSIKSTRTGPFGVRL